MPFITIPTVLDNPSNGLCGRHHDFHSLCENV